MHSGGQAEHPGVEVGIPREHAAGSTQYRRDLVVDLGPRARAMGVERVCKESP